MQQTALYMAAALAALWGVAHLLATRSVVSGFGDLTVDNRRIITMEWIVEGVSLRSLPSRRRSIPGPPFLRRFTPSRS
jgi:hypothetical protein